MVEQTNWKKSGVVVGAVAASVTVFVGLQSVANNWRAEDRAAGRVEARISLIATLPRPEDMPKELFEAVLDTEASKCPHYREVAYLLSSNPSVVVKNVGTEIIDVLRTETQMVYGMTDARGKTLESFGKPAPFVHRQSEREDYVLSRKLKPGDTATVSVAKGIVGQMTQAQSSDRPDWKHCGRFEARCYAHAVGNASTAFDASEPDNRMVLLMSWLPSGFTEEKCKGVLGITPTVAIYSPPK